MIERWLNFCLLEINDYFKRKKAKSPVKGKEEVLPPLIDSDLSSIIQQKHSNNLFKKVDKLVEFFHDPIINISIQDIELKYKSM